MTVFAGLVLRNLRISFRSRATLLYVLLPLLILAVLYPLWIVGLHADAVVPLASGTDTVWLAQSWIAAGLPIVSAFTGALGALGVLASDRQDRRFRDFGTTNLRPIHRALGYAWTAVVFACLTGLVAFVVLQLMLHLAHGLVPVPRLLVFGLGFTMLGSVHAAAFCLFLVSLLRGGRGYPGFAVMVSVLAGFATGAFVPVGMLPVPVRLFVQALPASHAATLARQALTWQATTEIYGAAGADLIWYQAYFGISQKFGERGVDPVWSLVFIVGITVILMAAALPLSVRGDRTRE